MKQKIYTLISILAATALWLSACGGAPQANLDPAAISTNAAQTVEARFTQQAGAFTETPAAATETTTPPAADATATLGYPPTLTTEPGQPTPTSNGKPCYAMTFLADITVPDGMIILPGTQFTKTWRVRNDGNCPWDQKYTLELAQGEAMTTTTRIPLTKVVNPGESVDISIDMTAPSTEGTYAGYWHLATPYGGYIGVGSYNQSLVAKIQVSPKPDRDFGAVSVAYDWTRTPQIGCGPDGAVYTFSATLTVNGPGEIQYQWLRIPYDGSKLDGGTLRFTAAGSKTVYFTWSFHNGAIQNIDRWVALDILGPKPRTFNRVKFNFHCSQ